VFFLWKKWRARRASPPDNPTETLRYLAAFVAAGISPRTSWQELPLPDAPGGPLASIQESLASGVPLEQAISTATKEADPLWRMLGATWSLAREVGAPLAPTLEALSSSMAERDHTEREIAATMAGPLWTMRLVMVLPLLALGGATLTGTPALSILLGTPVGMLAAAVASCLMAGAAWWMRILRRDALAPPPEHELALELFALATSGGALPEQAWRRVQRVREDYGLGATEGGEGQALTELSRRVGVPVSGLARQRARMVRERWRTDALAGINALGVKVVIPLGLLVLPAFVLVAIVPLGLALWSDSVQVAMSTGVSGGHETPL